jgi:hypothetical protein
MGVLGACTSWTLVGTFLGLHSFSSLLFAVRPPELAAPQPQEPVLERLAGFFTTGPGGGGVANNAQRGGEGGGGALLDSSSLFGPNLQTNKEALLSSSSEKSSASSSLLRTGTMTTTTTTTTTVCKERTTGGPLIVVPGISERIVWRKLQTVLEERQSYYRNAQQHNNNKPEVVLRKHRILTEGSSSSSSSNASGEAETTDTQPQQLWMQAPNDDTNDRNHNYNNVILQAILAYQKQQEGGTPSMPGVATCQLPLAASQACHTPPTYTILALVTDAAMSTPPPPPNVTTTTAAPDSGSGGENNWQRTLFVNCLQWMVDPSAHAIYIWLPDNLLPSLQNNTAYGRRLLAWHERTDHPVKLIVATDFWQALAQFQNDHYRRSTRGRRSSSHSSSGGVYDNHNQDARRRHTTTTTSEEGEEEEEEEGDTTIVLSDAVVWVSGNQVWRGNRNGLQQGFGLWKRQSASLVTAAAWQFQYETITNNGTLGQNEGTEGARTVAVLPRMLQIRATVAARNTTRVVDAEEPQQPQPQRPVLVDLTTATFHHRDYLCFLQHPVLAALRDATATDWNAARLGVAAWLSLVAPTHAGLSAGTTSTTMTTTSTGGRGQRHVRSNEAAAGAAQAEVHRRTESSTMSTAALGSLARDLRFFSIHSERNEADLAGLSIQDEDDGDDDGASTKLDLDERKRKVLAMLGGPPPLSNIHLLDKDAQPVASFGTKNRVLC